MSMRASKHHMKSRSFSAITLALVTASLAFPVASAHAEGGNPILRLNVVGDLNWNVYSRSFTQNSINYNGTGTLGYGGGLLVDLGLANAVGVESGALYFVRKANIDTAAGTNPNAVVPSGEMDVVHVPVDLILGLNDIVSVIGGVFDEIPVNSTSGNNNLGVGGGLRISLPVGGGTDFIADGRFNHGLSEQNGFHTNDIHLLVGLSFGGT